MLVGSAPFKGMNERDLLQNIKTKELSIPKDLLISRQSIEVLAKVRSRLFVDFSYTSKILF